MYENQYTPDVEAGDAEKEIMEAGENDSLLTKKDQWQIFKLNFKKY